MKPRPQDVLVIGGGVLGMSIAYHLSRLGASVTVFERDYPGAGASGANAAIVASSTTSPLSYALLEEWGKHLLVELGEAAGDDALFEACGRLRLVTEKEVGSSVIDVVRRNREAGIAVQYLQAESVEALEPQISSAGLLGAAYSPSDGIADPFRLLRVLVERINRRRGTLRHHTRVCTIRRTNRFVQVTTPRATYLGKVLVIASGVGSGQLSQQLGVTLPIRPMRGQILVTEQLPRLFHHVISPGITQCRSGNILLGVSMEDAGFANENTLSVLQTIARGSILKAPILKTACIIRCFSGLRPMPRDGLPILDRLPGYGNVYISVSHNGLTASQAIGQGMAQWIAEGEKPHLLAPFALAAAHRRS